VTSFECTTEFMTEMGLTLQPSKPFATALDLFAGCGGLALGFESAGFETLGYEMNADCCLTYNKNLSGKCEETTLSPESEFPSTDIIIGGPPCQPFSVGGNQMGLRDSRDGFPTFISAVDRIRPTLWLFENVRGMLYKNRAYFEEVISSLEDLGYIVDFKLLNAHHYGVPQNRERLIVVGHKGGFAFPTPINLRLTSGDALGGMACSVPPESRFLTKSQDLYIEKYERASKCVNPRDLNLSKPARTLTCRNLAGATGDMLRIKLADGRRRRVLVREAARLQTFPDWYEFVGRETSQFYQIGNAVPPLFARALATACADYLCGRVSGTATVTARRPKQGILNF
jgi:DNA (cytosine-5)-methyltransferase 1